jgi:hypothetical protein
MAGAVLYSTEGCHLCDDALKLFTGTGLPSPQIIDIADDPELIDRYGEIIPVLSFQGMEINWPFGIDEIRTLMETGQ